MKLPESSDPTLKELRSLVSRGRHAEADRVAQAQSRRMATDLRRNFWALRAEIALGLGKFTSALEWAAETLKGLDPAHRLRQSSETSKIRALLGLGRFREAGVAVESTFATVDRDGVLPSLFRGHIALRSGRIEEAAAQAQLACAKSIDRRERDSYIEALQLRARAARERGDTHSAGIDLNRAQKLSNGLRDTGSFAAVLSDRADLMAHTGDWTKAGEAAGQSGRIFARSFSPHEHLTAGRRTGLLELAQGDPNAALPAIEKAAGVARRGFGTTECRAEIDLLLADAQLAGRDPEGALERATAALASFRHAQDPGGLARAHVRRSLAALSASNIALALREARIAGSIKDAGPVAAGLSDLALGRILLMKDRPSALAAFDRASRNPSLYTPLLFVARLGVALADGASPQSDVVKANVARIESFGDRRIMAIVRSDLRDLFGVEAPSGAIPVDRRGDASSAMEDDEAHDEEFLPGLIGRSSVVRKLGAMVKRVAPRDIPVSIYGETGTGKEKVARALHDLSPRAGRRFVAVNSASLTDELFESTMFGHQRGSFTGAHSDQTGLVEDANGGTLFLDEVVDLSDRSQVRLLRFIESGMYRKVGDHREKKSDVRVVVAANRRLEDLVAAGRFRADLMHRVCGLEVTVPPLRERGSDIVRLARAFVSKQSGGKMTLSETAETAIAMDPWPGNVRELQQEMQRAVLFSDEALVEWRRPGKQHAPKPLTGAAPSLHAAIGDFERAFLKSALSQCAGQAEAARRLGISRQCLHEKVVRYGL